MLAFQRDNKTGFLEQEGNAAAVYLSRLNTRLAELKNESQLLGLLEVDQQLARERKRSSGDSGELRGGDPRVAAASIPMFESERVRQKIEVLGADNPSLVTAVREGNPNPNHKEQKQPDHIELVSMTIQPGEEMIAGQRLRAILRAAQKKSAA